MRTLPFLLPLRPSAPSDAGSGFSAAPVSLAAAQRASLGRGLAFVLLLVASSLASVYVPLALRGPGWIEGAAPGPDVAAR